MPRMMRVIGNVRGASIQRMGKPFISWAIDELENEKVHIQRRIAELQSAFSEAPDEDPETDPAI